MALIDDLLTELKDKLQVTWNDDSTNRQLTRMLNRGQKYFNELCGTEFTFEDSSPERELLMERCRYDWNNALSDFEDNFRKELGRLILKVAADDFEVGEEDATGTGT
ncbi:hypothetical protein G4D61_11110 [Bacillus ginsengihumi]|uniref:Uncharacterized protein n=1 Tax=Heyndrickxia ginsengihumi TaxID=363870 RepID=A0A6M0P722_9BACI|nr:hypothetical protein [Heyndrickxia ginsengihumi]NEY20504.1 hypothetical protein [Heyndrickxia ginsengihumi]